MNEDLEKLEKLVAAREVDLALALVNKLVKLVRSREATEQVLSTYFRLAEYRLGYKKALYLLNFEENQSLINLWVGRFLNSLGASDHALTLVSDIEPESLSDAYIKAEILLSNFQFHLAIKCYEYFFENDFEKQLKGPPVKILNYTDALSGANRSEEAYKIAVKLLKYHTRPIDLFIIHSACMEYLICHYEMTKAFEHLKQVELHIPPGEKKVDYALYLKWKGIYYCSTGMREEGIPLLYESIKLLKSYNNREEAWVCIYEYLYHFNQISKKQFSYYIHFPGLSISLKEYFLKKYPETEEVSGHTINQNAYLFIDLENNELCMQGQWNYGLKKESKLIAICKYTEESGIGFQKCSNFLWPDEPYSFLKFEDRIFQLIKRVKTQFNIIIELKKNKLYLTDTQMVGISTYRKLPSFLNHFNDFKAQDLSAWYKISNSNVSKLLKIWTSQDLITKDGHGANTRYIKI